LQKKLQTLKALKANVNIDISHFHSKIQSEGDITLSMKTFSITIKYKTLGTNDTKLYTAFLQIIIDSCDFLLIFKPKAFLTIVMP
jgi:hypothetical protein